MTEILNRIAAYKREEVARAKAKVGLSEIEDAARSSGAPLGFAAALETEIEAGRHGLIAEIKRASPSKGTIREDFDPASLARACRAGGAACLSVLTDAPSFRGAPEYLAAARDATGLPTLCKEFMLDVYQIAAARAWGADCVLLIMAMIDDALAAELEAAAFGHGMDVLVEVHDEAELERALSLESRLIGVNNRDLGTFRTEIETTERLAPLIPGDRLAVGESGLGGPEDLARLSAVGVNAFLIGERLMREADVEAATRAILAKPEAVGDVA